ncbi:MAG: arylsulfatase [Acidobacteria bacterium]|nr:arylsulfatase [Acidobacteriota bacterium]
MQRRQFLASAAAAAAAPSRRPPNIVFIVLDDLGSGDFGCYGQKLIRTPHADSLARQGIRFTDCYAGGAVCAPSRASLMTGLHQGHAPIRANAGTIPLAAGDVTVAQLLQRAGYATGGFGKWGLGDARTDGIPTRHGFDRFYGYLHQIHAHSYYPDFLWDNEKKHVLAGNKDGKGSDYSADLIAERSFQFLRDNRGKPFFLYACYTLPHANFEVPDLGPYQDRPWTRGQKTYAAMVTRADRYAGTILGLLKEYGLEQDTVVFLTSDNGAHSGDEKGYELFRSNGALRGEKAQLYEGGIRVPMIVRWPGKTKPGATSTLPWAFWDVLPTLTEIAGLRAPAVTDGISVVPELAGGKQKPHEYLYWESDQFDRKRNDLDPARLSQAVRLGEWKAIRLRPGAPLELYNLRADPGEAKNVAAANPAVVSRVEEILKTARTAPRPHNTGTFDWVR